MVTVNIAGKKRELNGKAQIKSLRKEGQVPCVLYGGKEIVHFSADFRSFKDVVYTPDFKTVTLDLDGKSITAILKDIQFHPVSEDIIHVDLLELVPNQVVKVNIPVRFKGESPGVKLGGKLMQLMRKVQVKTTPEKLVSEVYVSIEELELGQSVRVKDIEVPGDSQIMNNANIPVAQVEIPRALRSAAASQESES